MRISLFCNWFILFNKCCLVSRRFLEILKCLDDEKVVQDIPKKIGYKFTKNVVCSLSSTIVYIYVYERQKK